MNPIKLNLTWLPLNKLVLPNIYGRFHPGRELTAIELENFWFAVKPIKFWINLKNLCTFVYV